MEGLEPTAVDSPEGREDSSQGKAQEWALISL